MRTHHVFAGVRDGSAKENFEGFVFLFFLFFGISFALVSLAHFLKISEYFCSRNWKLFMERKSFHSWKLEHLFRKLTNPKRINFAVTFQGVLL
jgi:hypothetical protein